MSSTYTLMAFLIGTPCKQVISDDVNGNAVIHLSATDSITLVGIHTADLHQTDFII